MLDELTQRNSTQFWLEGLEKLQVPCGPVNTIKDVFDDPQIQHREMEISMPHPLSGKGDVSLIGSSGKNVGNSCKLPSCSAYIRSTHE